MKAGGVPPGSPVGTVQVTSTRSPDSTTMRRPETSGGTLTTGVGPGGAPADRGLGAFPRVLDRLGADDRLVDIEAAVDDVQQHGLAGHEVEGRGQELVVLGDEVDLAGAPLAPATIGGVTARARLARAGGDSQSAAARPAARAGASVGSRAGRFHRRESMARRPQRPPYVA